MLARVNTALNKLAIENNDDNDDVARLACQFVAALINKTTSNGIYINRSIYFYIYFFMIIYSLFFFLIIICVRIQIKSIIIILGFLKRPTSLFIFILISREYFFFVVVLFFDDNYFILYVYLYSKQTN